MVISLLLLAVLAYAPAPVRADEATSAAARGSGGRYAEYRALVQYNSETVTLQEHLQRTRWM